MAARRALVALGPEGMTIVLDTLAEHVPTPATPATIATLVELTTETTLPRLAERLASPVPVLADTAAAASANRLSCRSWYATMRSSPWSG